MSRESKIIQSSTWGAEKTIYHYESFGWELLSLNGKQITMSRETQNPVYTDLVKYQGKYEELVNDYNNVKYPQKPIKPEPFDFGKCCLLFVLLIFPSVLYICHKVKQNKKYKEDMDLHNQEVQACENKKAEILKEIDQLLLDSRSTFFGKQ